MLANSVVPMAKPPTASAKCTRSGWGLRATPLETLQRMAGLGPAALAHNAAKSAWRRASFKTGLSGNHMRREILLATLFLTGAARAQPSDPDKQALALVKQMTPEERNLLLHGFFSRPNAINKLPQIGAPYAAGYTPGIARLGIPQLA